MDQIYSTKNLSVGQLIEQIDTGEIGLPALQRPFVWRDTKVRDLFDSLMRGYPAGYLMLWESPSSNRNRQIGQTHSFEQPRNLIIDGQQRLTSLYAVIKGKKVLNSDYREKSIEIGYCPAENKFEVTSVAMRRNPEWISNISDVFNAASLLELTRDFLERLEESRKEKGSELTTEERHVIESRISALSNIPRQSFPVFDVNADAEEEEVSEIFVRVNSKGTPLKQNDFVLTLLSLYWDDGREMIENFSRATKNPPRHGEPSPYNSVLTASVEGLIRVVMAYGFNRGRLKYAYKLLRGADFDKKGTINDELRQQRFDILQNKLPDVLNLNNWAELLKALLEAGYVSRTLITSANAAYFAYAFLLIGKNNFGVPNQRLRDIIALWFFYSALTSQYSGSFETTAEQQLGELSRAERNEQGFRDFFLGRVRQRLTEDYFRITLTGVGGLTASGSGNNAWNAYVAALNILGTPVLFSNSGLTVRQLLSAEAAGTRNALEKHHLFPKKYLTDLGYDKREINQMANYAYIDWNDNLDILDRAPAEYYPIVCQGRTTDEIRKMEEENALPAGWESMPYQEFLEERRKLMAKRIQEAYEVLYRKSAG